MSFTRTHDDTDRIAIQLQQQTDQERWYLDTPGNGDKPCFMLDPQIRIQKWGGNLWTGSTDIQSNLMGLNKPLTRDCKPPPQYTVQNSRPIQYPTCSQLTTDESRVTAPAWTFKDLEQNHRYILLNNPQQHSIVPFVNYESSRVIAKQDYKRG